MASRNQNRPPRSRSPHTRREIGDENPLVKRRRLEAVGRGVVPTTTGQTRRTLIVANNLQEATTAAANAEAGNAEECHEFTKEEVEAILNERPKAKKFDLKAKYEHAADHNKRLKHCIKWFQQCDESHVLDKEKLKNSLESSEKKCIDTELEKKNKDSSSVGESLCSLRFATRVNACEIGVPCRQTQMTLRAAESRLSCG